MTTAEIADLPEYWEMLARFAAKASQRREERDATRLKVEELEKRMADETK